MTVGAHYTNTLGVHYSLGVMQEGGCKWTLFGLF
jgi:hypothetical protein